MLVLTVHFVLVLPPTTHDFGTIGTLAREPHVHATGIYFDNVKRCTGLAPQNTMFTDIFPFNAPNEETLTEKIVAMCIRNGIRNPY